MPEAWGSLEAIFASAAEVMTIHRHAFAEMVARAQSLEREGKVADAVVAARMAADFASTNHTGMYVSPELEALLQRAGRTLGARVRSPERVSGRKQHRSAGMHVLHVLTAAYDIGGHTRLLWRWIASDKARRHSVVLTHQRHLTPPQPLRQSVERSGGQLHRLDARPSGLAQKAQRLAELASGVDLVVLHTHPYDVVPSLAFAPASEGGAAEVPVVLLNQADHVFWLSRSVSRLVADLRPSARDLGVRRRGVPAANSAFLPLPLQPPRRTLPKAEAKEKLGLAAHEKLVFSVALPYKYTALGELDFARIFAELARRHDVTVLVCGPTRDDARWRAAETASGGRLRALGRRVDLSLFHQAADIYVDSFPFGSSTSLLEAGSYGVPVLTLNPVAGAGVMTLDDLALPAAGMTYTNLDAYSARLLELLENGSLRRQVGAETASRIMAVHSGEAWQVQLEEMYARAFAAPPMPPLECSLAAAEAPDLLLTSLSLLAGRSRTPAQVYTEHTQLLPLGSRLSRVLLGRERPGRALSDWLGQQYEFLLGKGRQSISG